MGAGSSFKVLHTLDASARTKTVSGRAPKLSASKASSLLTGTFKATANAAMCIPDACRASRNKPPAVTPAASGTSLIESPALIQTQFQGLREPPAQLVCQLLHGHCVAQGTLHLDSQP